MSEDIVNEIKTEVTVLSSKIDTLSEKYESMNKSISNWFKSFVIAFVGVFGGLITFAVGYGGVKMNVEINSKEISLLKRDKVDKSTIDDKFLIILEKIDKLKHHETE